MKISSPSYTRQPAPTLRSLRQALTNARSPQSRRRAALAVMAAYDHYCCPPNARAQAIQLTRLTAAMHCLPMLTGRQRQRVLAFCGLISLMVEAAGVLREINGCRVKK